MPSLDEIRDSAEWPPPAHADRIETQDDYQRLYRNRRDEILQRWSSDLLRWMSAEEELIPYPSAKIAARTLAAFLFGEEPTLDHEDEKVVEAIREIAAGTDLVARLREGAITQAVQGEVYLRPAWDVSLSPHPILTVIPGRIVIPSFRHGMLRDASIVTTYTDEERTARVYWRHIEYHEPGRIENVLYRGTADRLGAPVELTARPETADEKPVIETQIEELLVVHVPLDRDGESPHGISLFDGLEALIVGIHRLYSQEQHDAEIARRRIAVSEEFLTSDATGRRSFDRRTDLLVLTEEAAGSVGAERAPVTPVEFGDDLVMRERIRGRLVDFLVACGISPKTIDADNTGEAASGTARKLAQSMTLRTVSGVGRYWQSALARALDLSLSVARTHLPAWREIPTTTVLPSIELADGFVNDPAELARILADLDTAAAISTYEKVKALHPEWSDEQIEAEVAAIGGPPPPPALPAFGRPPTPPDDDEDEEEDEVA